MALLSELVRVVAAVEGLDEVSVGIFARHAREAGHLSQGGRGRSAAKMTSRDAVNLLIAVNGCALAKEVAIALPRYRDLRAIDKNKKSNLGICDAGSKFGDDLERLIEIFISGSPSILLAEIPPIIIRFRRPNLEADLSIYTIEDGATVGRYGFYRNSEAERDGSQGDRQDETAITTRTLKAVAEVL